MAKKSGAKPAKSDAKSVAAKGIAKKPVEASAKAATKAPVKAKANVEKAAAKSTTKPDAKAAAEAAPKKMSANLMAAIEKRKQEKEAAAKKGGMFGRPMGRRGRRPKRPIEYTPVNSEDGGGDPYDVESQPTYEGFEYDTGIRLKDQMPEEGYGLERFDDYDEELNFDR